MLVKAKGGAPVWGRNVKWCMYPVRGEYETSRHEVRRCRKERDKKRDSLQVAGVAMYDIQSSGDWISSHQ